MSLVKSDKVLNAKKEITKFLQANYLMSGNYN
jgi:hypothetical protein